MLSHILVYQLFHMESGMHHLVNVLFHALAAVFLFAALERAGKAPWPSAFVAFMFALHPLHVESVAWVAERKDVLSAFFLFLALYAYVRYAEQPSLRGYLLMTATFIAGLMSKTMLVTFPFILLLFDVWPLRRFRFPQVLWEKLPLFLMVAGATLVAFFTQRSAGAFMAAPLSLRIENTLVSYVVYIRQTFWPLDLVVLYPYPESIPAAEIAGAAAFLLAVSVLAVFTWRTRPYIATGWFWFLGTLVPVIGVIQLGQQAHADRYAYIPMTGLSIILAWAAADVIKRWPRTKTAIALAGTASCLACALIASNQVAYWQDGPTLFRHATTVIQNNYPAMYELAWEYNRSGQDLLQLGHRTEAIGQFQEALQVRPNWAEVHNNLAIQLAGVAGRSADAAAHFEAALRIDPNLAQAHRNLGLMLSSVPGRGAEALAHLEAAQRIQPDPELKKVIDRLRTEKK
jgi:hypothetical protein